MQPDFLPSMLSLVQTLFAGRRQKWISSTSKAESEETQRDFMTDPRSPNPLCGQDQLWDLKTSLPSADLPKAVLVPGYLPVIFLALNGKRIIGKRKKKLIKIKPPQTLKGWTDQKWLFTSVWDDTEWVHLLVIGLHLSGSFSELPKAPSGWILKF